MGGLIFLCGILFIAYNVLKEKTETHLTGTFNFKRYELDASLMRKGLITQKELQRRLKAGKYHDQ